ncbi:class I SAM-dependent methyltransferase [Sinorhizobium sp. BG8]|uniref:class I SAM-dependent methyltransferase n=1 Tax=Sinorhizobium sp. BG8 TaxID=2613773 RepID=UPI00193CDEFF|nr:class I SAM-dependent methyltransferase [Sinorhizobium sp. BG8]
MSEASVKKEAATRIKSLLKEEKSDQAAMIVALFKAGERSSFDDLVFYGRLLLQTGQLQEAKKILDLALAKKRNQEVERERETVHWLLQAGDPFASMRAGAALAYIMSQPNIENVLDVGSGGGEHALVFAKAGKKVHCVDFGRSVYVHKSKVLQGLDSMDSVRRTVGDFMKLEDPGQYDLVWCSHVLEHQPNANAFLVRCLSLLAPDGWLAITVPPLKHAVVGGHLSLWNAGLLLYQLIISGNDCSDAVVMNYNYNVSVIVRKHPIVLPELDYDSGDVDRLAKFFPPGCSEAFDGRMVGYSTELRSNEDTEAESPEPPDSTQAGSRSE